MAAQHLPRDLVRPSSGLKELAQKKTTKKMPHVTVIITKMCFVASIARCITIVYTVGYLQIFNAEYFYSSKHCHDL